MAHRYVLEFGQDQALCKLQVAAGDASRLPIRKWRLHNICHCGTLKKGPIRTDLHDPYAWLQTHSNVNVAGNLNLETWEVVTLWGACVYNKCPGQKILQIPLGMLKVRTFKTPPD